MTLKTIDIERARFLLSYDEKSGEFTWRGSGRKAGCTTPAGYVLIGIDGSLFLAHRLAWAFVTGQWSEAPHIDHINRERSDNRWSNLREASVPQNMANSGARSSSASGVKGVSWCKSTRKWRATITSGGRQRSLGRHSSLEDAAMAYQRAATGIHGAFAASELGVTFYDLAPRETE